MSKRKTVFEFWNYISVALLLLFLFFLIYPLIKLLREAVFLDGQFTLDAFVKFFSSSSYYATIWNSVKIALCVTAASLLLGIPFAYFYSFYLLKGRKVIFVLCLLCTMSAPFIGAYAWILLMGNAGLITKFLESVGISGVSIYGFWGIVFVQTLKLFPLVVIYMNGTFRDIDNSLLEAAESMGCTGVKRFFRVIMTLTMPTILAAALLVFMRSFADFGTPVLIGRGYTTFPVLIYNQYLGENGTNYHFAAAIGVIAILVTTVIFLIQKIATNHFRFTISSMHPVVMKKAGGVPGALMHIFCYALLFLALMPQIYIINMSFRNYNNTVLQPGYSLKNWSKAVEKHLFRAIGNSLIISVFALLIIVVIAVLISYLVVRRNNFLNNLIDTFSMLPYILPGAVIGIAMIVGFSRKPFNLTGTLAIMVIALVIRRIPFTSRSATAAMMKVQISTEEAALSLGASKLKTFVGITVPMMSGGLIAGAILSWVSIITEMSSGIILYTNQTMTLTIGTYAMINTALYGVAAVFATVTLIFTLICLAVYLKVSKSEDVQI